MLLAKRHKLEVCHVEEAYAFGQALWDITDGTGIKPTSWGLIQGLP